MLADLQRTVFAAARNGQESFIPMLGAFAVPCMRVLSQAVTSQCMQRSRRLVAPFRKNPTVRRTGGTLKGLSVSATPLPVQMYGLLALRHNMY